MDKDIREKTQLLLKKLEEVDVIRSMVRIGLYPDEPKMFSYNSQLNPSSAYSDGHSYLGGASGFSFTSKHLAFLKCLSESIERFSQSCYRKSGLIEGTYKSIAADALDPNVYFGKPSDRSRTFKWVEGHDLFTKRKVFIPAQLVFLTYHGKGEPFLLEQNTNGAAAGFSHEFTLTKGIYEVVERDAFMCVYLAKLKVPKINLVGIKNNDVQLLLKAAARYRLELATFDIRNDLGIPTYFTLLVDKTGLGPVISCGLKSSLDEEEALLGSMHESFHSRPWIKGEMLKKRINKFSVKDNKINSILDRALIWISPSNLKRLDFLLSQPEIDIELNNYKKTSKQELEDVTRILLERKMRTCYVDVSLPEFKKIGHLTYKVIIPALQPLYLKEKNRYVNEIRLQQVAKYLKQSFSKINAYPHPFL